METVEKQSQTLVGSAQSKDKSLSLLKLLQRQLQVGRRNKSLPQEKAGALRQMAREDVDISIPKDFPMTEQNTEQPDTALKLALV